MYKQGWHDDALIVADEVSSNAFRPSDGPRIRLSLHAHTVSRKSIVLC